MLAWLGICFMFFCISLPYFVACMSVDFASVKVFHQRILLTYLLLLTKNTTAIKLNYAIRNTFVH